MISVSVVGTLNGLTWWICGVDVCIFGALLDGEFLEFVFMGSSSWVDFDVIWNYTSQCLMFYMGC
jgi:hypothetical protein